MEELQVIETTSGRHFKPWASREDVQAIKQETVQAVVQAVQDPASVTAIASEIAGGKQAIASAINAKGGSASATESFSELAQDIQDTPTSGVLSRGIVQSEPFGFLDYVCKYGAFPFTEIDDDSVTVISRPYTFYSQTQLLKVNMPKLTTISGDYAFQSCSALQEVNMPNLTTISSVYAFHNCTSLLNVTLPNLTTINGGYAFFNCTSLKNVTLPNLTTINGSDTFYNCSALQNVTLPNLTTISKGSIFSGCTSLLNVTLPNLTTISGYAFFSCTSLLNVTLPNVTTISNVYAFSGCTSLLNVTLPNLTTINGSYAFFNCTSLLNVIFGTITNMVEPFYDGKPNLRNITIGQDTNINLPFQNWTATNVIAKGQSGIDELNTNLQTNLISKLYQGGGKILRLGAALYDVTTQETRDMVTAKGWTLQRG